MSRLLELVTGGSATPRLKQKLHVFWEFTEKLASLSCCRRLTVGCVVIPQDLSTILSIGYNGPPAGMSNDACRGQEGDCGCIHAEANALVKLKTRESGLVLLTSASPCEQCAGLILNSNRIAAIVYGQEYRNRLGPMLLRSAGLVVVTVEKLRL